MAGLDKEPIQFAQSEKVWRQTGTTAGMPGHGMARSWCGRGAWVPSGPMLMEICPLSLQQPKNALQAVQMSLIWVHLGDSSHAKVAMWWMYMALGGKHFYCLPRPHNRLLVQASE